MNHDNIAVMDNRITTIEQAVKDLVDLSRQQAKVNNNLEMAIKMLQQAHEDSGRVASKNTGDISELKKNQNMLRGGWFALVVIGTVIVGLSTVAGALAAALALRH